MSPATPFQEIVYERVYVVHFSGGPPPEGSTIELPSPSRAANEVERRLNAGATTVSVYQHDRPKP